MKMAKAVSIKFLVKVLLSIAISVFIAMLKELKFKIQVAFPNIRLCLFNRHPDESDFAFYSNEFENLESVGSGDGHLLMLNGSSSSFVNVPVKSVVASIKSRVAVIEYGDFLARNEMEEDDNECIVCCDPMEKKDEMRDMPNCCHAFHTDCMDRWLDEGQITCPLCRSSIIPPNTFPWKLN